MKTFSILIGAALSFILAGCSAVHDATVGNFESKKRWWYDPKESIDTPFVDFKGGSIGHQNCILLINPFSFFSFGGIDRPPEGQKLIILSSDLKEGDRHCRDFQHFGFNYFQTKEDTFTVHASARSEGDVDRGNFEKQVMIATALLGRVKGFTYGTFELIDDNVFQDAGDTETTTTGGRTGMTIPGMTVKGVTLPGMTTGSQTGTQSTRTVGQYTEMQRKHIIKFYTDDPGSVESFNIGLLLKSLDAESYEVRGI